MELNSSSRRWPVAPVPEEMPAFLRREQERYAEVIRKANITLE